MHQLEIIGDGPATPGRLETAPPRLGEQDDFETLFWPQPEGWERYQWTAWYRDDSPDDYGEMAYGYGDTELRAINDLRDRFPREDR